MPRQLRQVVHGEQQPGRVGVERGVGLARLLVAADGLVAARGHVIRHGFGEERVDVGRRAFLRVRRGAKRLRAAVGPGDRLRRLRGPCRCRARRTGLHVFRGASIGPGPVGLRCLLRVMTRVRGLLGGVFVVPRGHVRHILGEALRIVDPDHLQPIAVEHQVLLEPEISIDAQVPGFADLIGGGQGALVEQAARQRCVEVQRFAQRCLNHLVAGCALDVTVELIPGRSRRGRHKERAPGVLDGKLLRFFGGQNFFLSASSEGSSAWRSS